jgi:hypothetical protein
MLAGDYIQQNKHAFQRMAAAGIVSCNLLHYSEVNLWHTQNGSSVRLTAAHFGIPERTVNYINKRMNQQIITEDLL